MNAFVLLDMGCHFLGNCVVMSKDGAEKFFHAVGFLGSHLVRFGESDTMLVLNVVFVCCLKKTLGSQ